MSGGFFRGTSADQDTRFSNKQAKLLKTQKFAPELDQLVDMTKVKMDVIRPWIATRATELLGFEDEVLINFVYGLLDGKEVDGKQIQIQLTGFMEKNTGKFMKELWSLLLSAQNNASGVPQQFLDAKAEETKKRKAETDRITQEIQRRKEKEGRELEQEKQKRMDGEVDMAKSAYATSDSVSKRFSSVHPEEETEGDVRQGPRAKSRRSISPQSDDRSPIHRPKHSPSRSFSKSCSKSRSHSKEGRKSRSLSVSPQSQRHLLSPRRRYQSPVLQSISSERRPRSPRRSISPHHRHSSRNTRSPSRRRSPYSGRRSASPSRRRSPSPLLRRSPHARRRSPSYLRRRSPSPLLRRSPRSRYRSPSPLRRRSPPMRRRSPSPLRRRSPSPLRRRSPVQVRRRTPPPSRRRSPVQRRPLSPARHRSPSPMRRRSPPRRSPEQRRKSPPPPRSPRNHAADSQMSLRQRKRSRSPYQNRSPSYSARRSLSRETDSRTNGVHSKGYQDEYASRRSNERRSPVRHALDRDVAERPNSRRMVPDSISHKLPISLRSPGRGSRDQHDSRGRRHDVPSDESPNQSESPRCLAKVNLKDNRSSSHSESPARPTSRQIARHDSPEASKEETSQDKLSDEDLPEKHAHRLSHSPVEIEYGPGGIRGHSLDGDRGRPQSANKLSREDESSSEERINTEHVIKNSHGDDYVVNSKHIRSQRDEYKQSRYETESVKKSKGKGDQSHPLDTFDSDSEETDAYKHRDSEKRKYKKSDKHKRDSENSSDSDSQIYGKKEAKRRRKDEKRSRKEERRRKREERHRRRLERRSSKLKVKSMDTVTPPSDFERNHSFESDGDASTRKGSKLSDTEERESDQKKLEIELRQKALESLKAKKAINH